MKDLFKTKNHALILSHQGPDGDSIGSSVSLSLYLNKIGIDNMIIFPDPYPSFYSWVKGIKNSIIATENLELIDDLFDKSDISRPNLVAFTSQESTYDISDLR